jgi:hypothetical protein
VVLLSPFIDCLSRFAFSRLQYHVLLGKPSLQDVEAIVRRQMQRMPCAEAEGEVVDVSLMCSHLMAFEPSCADAEALCHKALTAAIREEILRSMDSGDQDAMGKSAPCRVVHQRHFDAALRELTGWGPEVAKFEQREEILPLSTSPFEFQLTGAFHF